MGIKNGIQLGYPAFYANRPFSKYKKLIINTKIERNMICSNLPETENLTAKEE